MERAIRVEVMVEMVGIPTLLQGTVVLPISADIGPVQLQELSFSWMPTIITVPSSLALVCCLKLSSLLLINVCANMNL